jgi:hypothetical protein
VLTGLLQYRWLSKDYPDTDRLRLAYKVKGTIALVLIILSIAFGVAMYKANDVGGQFFRTGFDHALTCFDDLQPYWNG